MPALAALLGIDPAVLQLITALLGLIAAIATATSAVLGILNRRRALRTQAAAEATGVAVGVLVELLAEQRTDRDKLWAAFLEKDTVANPAGVRRIATETAHTVTESELRPMRQFLAATEIVESRREHRPETDVIRVLQEITA
jgi:Na+/proline symporter